MSNIEKFQQVEKDIQEASEILHDINKELDKLPSDYQISNQLFLSSNSSDSQFVYGLGVLNSRIIASKELGIDNESLKQMKKDLIDFHQVLRELRAFDEYHYDLLEYRGKVLKALTPQEKLELENYPEKPKK